MNRYLDNIIRFRYKVEKYCEKHKKKSPQILYASKYLSPSEFADLIKEAKEKGFRMKFGENRVQEAERKLMALKDPGLRESFSYCLIGTLQSNKINKAVRIFDGIYSVDSLRLAEKIDGKISGEGSKPIEIYLEVNISGEESKSGMGPGEVADAVLAVKQLKHVTINGLMTMPPFTQNPADSASYFRILRSIADSYSLKTSMGTSQDWKEAVDEGTDMIRIGGSVFT